MADPVRNEGFPITFDWDPAWDTGNPSIDRQHRQLLGQMERLARAAQGRERGETERALMLLGEYVETHFRDEEVLMRDSEYPHLLEHRALHDDLRRQAQALVTDFMEHLRPLPEAVTVFLVGWLKGHLDGPDRRLADYLRTR